MVRFRLIGRGALHDSLKEPTERSDLLQRIREVERDGEPRIWIESIEDGTGPEIDLELRAKGQDFLAEFLTYAKSAKKDPEVQANLRKELSSVARALRTAGAPELDLQQIEDWIDKAAILGADRLFDQESH